MTNLHNWRDHAKCLGQPTERYDVNNLPATNRQKAAARQLCDGCPVIVDCADEALEHWHYSRGHVLAGVPIPNNNEGRDEAHAALTRIVKESAA